MDLLKRFYKKEVRALSKIITAVETNQNGIAGILGELYPKAAPAIRIGITGPPGAGKSTLVNGLAHLFLKNNNKVGILAVDPTSPFTGGALLGDRVRMHEFPTNGDVYFRSMATRGARGGLASSTDNAAVAVGAFGYDFILIETVGVGQIEIDIIDACDVVVVILVPESGDSVQTMKAGLMEIGDIFVVNKSDRPGSERMVAELRNAIETWKRNDESWDAPVIPTEATNGKNIDKLYGAICKFIEHQKATGRFESHRREQISHKIVQMLQNCFKQEFLENYTDGIKLDRILDEIEAGRSSPYEIVNEIYENLVTKNKAD